MSFSQNNIDRHVSSPIIDSKIQLLNQENRPSKGLELASNLLLLAQKENLLIIEAEAYEHICVFQQDLGNNSLALDAAFKALRIYESLLLEDGQGVALSNIANLYFTQNELDNSLKYLNKALKLTQDKDIYNEIAIKVNIAEVFRKKNRLDSSKYYLTKVLSEIKLNDFQKEGSLYGYALGNLGMIFNKEGKLDSSSIYLKNAIETIKLTKDFYSTSTYLAELGKVYYKKGQLKKAFTKTNEALSIAKKANLKEQIRDFNQLLSNFYADQNNYKKALYHQQQFQIYQDSLVNKENVKKIEQLKAGYEIDKRETQIGLLHKVNSTQKKWLISLGVGILSFILLASLLFMSRRKVRKANIVLAQQKEEISKREQEKAWLLRELNHRVKNNLQMVASLLNLQSNKLSGHPAQEAILIGKQRVEALSLVHRKLYQEGVDTRINIKDYITELILGLFHAYNANFKPQITISDDVSVNIDSAIPLALIVNEIIINCLKYAYKGIENPSLEVEISMLPEQRLAIHIWDNGVGFDENAEMKDSLGMKIIKSLTRQLDGSVTHFNEDGAHWRLNVLGK